MRQSTNILKNNMKAFPLILHICITVVFIIIFFIITQKFKPIPISDFKDYWDTSTNLQNYYKGGLLFLLYAPLKLLNLSAYWSAFLVNSSCFIMLSYILWLDKKSHFQLLSSFVLLLIGIWFSALVPIVNSDIPTIIFVLFGLKIFSISIKNNKNILILTSIILLTIGLSIRSQFFYAFLLLSIFLLIFYATTKKRTLLLKRSLLFIISSVVISFSANFGLEAYSSNKIRIEEHKRVPFYTGLIETAITDNCGRYNTSALKLAQEEIAQPLSSLLIKKYSQIPLERYIKIISCKWEHYFFSYNQSTVGWLRSHLRINETIENFDDVSLYLWDYLEGISVHLLKLISTFLYLLFLYNFKKQRIIDKFVFGILTYILLFFLAIHTVMEFQARYLISPIILTTITMIYLHADILQTNNKNR